jgi:hypothetical protein
MANNHTNQAENMMDEAVELTNPAKRIHSIIDPVLQMSNGIPAVEIWANAFGIDPGKAQQDPHDVVDRLRMMRDQISLLRNFMHGPKFSADLYEPALNAVIAMISVSNLSSQWGNFKPHVLPEHMLALRWCAQAIASEVGLTHGELQRLLDSISVFRASVVDDDLPEQARAFVLHQLDLMMRGIHDYPIRGRQAVRDAVKEAAIDVLDADVAEAAPVELREKLAHFWKAGLGAAESGEKMVKLITGIAEAVPKLVSAVHAATNSLSS